MKNIKGIAFTVTLLLSVALYSIVDYYAVLEIPRDATTSEINTAFRRMSVKYHPDKHSGNPAAHERYVQIVQARDTLKDPALREEYDFQLAQGESAAMTPAAALLTDEREAAVILPTKKASVSQVLTSVGNVLFQGTLAWAQVVAARGDTQVKASLAILKDTKRPMKERAKAASDLETRFVTALNAMNPVLDELVVLALLADPEKGQKMKDMVDTYKGYLYYINMSNEVQRQFLTLT